VRQADVVGELFHALVEAPEVRAQATQRFLDDVHLLPRLHVLSTPRAPVFSTAMSVVGDTIQTRLPIA